MLWITLDPWYAENMTSRSPQGYIGEGLVVRGTLSGKGDMDIDGHFEGELNLQGLVSVGPSGDVRAPVTAKRLTISGNLVGEVHAEEEVVVREGGRLTGDVHTPSVALDDGGVLLGSVHMNFDI